MGHKVNPVGMRIGVNRDWNSRWYAEGKDYAQYLNEDIKIRKFITKNCKDAMISHVEIERSKTDKGTKLIITIFSARSALIIGQEGKNINKLTEDVARLLNNKAIRIQAVDVENPDLDANIVAQKIAKQLEERASFRTAQKKAIKDVRKAGAKGCRTLVSGRLGGADIARSEGYKEGIIPLHTLRSDIDFAIAEAATTYGKLGVKVWICRGEVKAKKTDEKEDK